MVITLSGQPMSTQTIYLQHGHIRFMKKTAKERKEQYQWEAKSQWKKPMLTCEIAIGIKIYFGTKRKADWDNFHKLSMDALSGIVWEDDSQIKKCLVEVFYDKENPRLEISVGG